MSAVTARPSASTARRAGSSSDSGFDRGDELIGEHLQVVRAAIWRSALLGAGLRLVGGLLSALLVFLIVDQWIWGMGKIPRLIAAVAGLAAATWWTAKRIVPLLRMRVSTEYAAFSLDQDAPDLRQAMTSYVTLRDQRQSPGLRGIVVRSIGVRAARHLQSHGMVMPTETAGTLRLSLTVLAIFACLAIYLVVFPRSSVQSFKRLAVPLANIEVPTRARITSVEPGNSEATYGREVGVTASVSGVLGGEPPRLHIRSTSHAQIPPLTLDPSNGLDQYATTIPGDLIVDDFEYWITAGDATSDRYQIQVRDEPTLVIRRVLYQPPSYTGLPQRTSSSGNIEAIEATLVTVTATTNRPVRQGRIEFNPREVGGQITATAGFAGLAISEDGRTVTASWELRPQAGGNSARIDSYRLRVWDLEGNGNPDPIIYPIQVIPDLVPEVRITVPNRWPKEVPTNAQQVIETRAVDPDFGLTEIRLRIERNGMPALEPQIFSAPAGRRGNQVALYRLRPDLLGFRPGDTIAITAIARDNRPTPEHAGHSSGEAETAEPVILKIVAPPRRNQPPEDDDGLSPRDDQPVSSQSSGDQSSAGGSGAAGGGDGEQSSSDSDPNAEGAAGGSGGENSGEPQNETKGSNDGTGDGENDQPNKDRQGSNDGGGGGGQSDPQPDPGQQDGSSDASTGDQPTGNNSPENNSSAQSTNSGSGESSSENAGDNQAGQANEAAGDPGDASGDSTAAGNPANQSSSPDDNRANGNGQGSRSDRPPANDAEAMERIRDYLERQQNASKRSDQDSASNPEGRQTPGERSSTGGARPSDANQSTNQDGGQSEPSATPPAGNETQGNETKGDDPDGNQSAAGDSADRSEASNSNDGTEAADRDDRQPSKPSGDADPSGSPQQSRENNSGDSPQNSQQPSPSGADENGQDRSANNAQQSAGNGARPEEQGTGQQAADQNAADGKPGNTANDSPQPSPSDDPSQAGQQPQGESGEAETGQGDKGEGDKGQGDKGEGENNSPDGSGQTGGEAGQPAGNPGDNSAGDSSAAKSPQNKGSEAGTPSPRPDDSQSTSPSGASGGQGSQGENSPQASRPDDAQSSSSSSGGGEGSGAGSSGTPGATSNEPPPPPDPIDVEAARRATDMVLDTLQHQRETPDQQLLDELDWTPEQLRRFIDRWQNARELADDGSAENRQAYEDALKSLGLQPQNAGQSRRFAERDDQLRGLRETGRRANPPAKFRNDLEAFRRAISE